METLALDETTTISKPSTQAEAEARNINFNVEWDVEDDYEEEREEGNIICNKASLGTNDIIENKDRDMSTKVNILFIDHCLIPGSIDKHTLSPTAKPPHDTVPKFLQAR